MKAAAATEAATSQQVSHLPVTVLNAFHILNLFILTAPYEVGAIFIAIL